MSNTQAPPTNLYRLGRDGRRELARRLGMSTRFLEELDMQFDHDGESVVLDCSQFGEKCGQLAIPTKPSARTKELFSGQWGIWSGPRGVAGTGIVMVGFDLVTSHGAYQWGVDSSLICCNPDYWREFDGANEWDRIGLIEHALELNRRHDGASMLLVDRSRLTPDCKGVFEALANKLQDYGFTAPIIDWTQTMPSSQVMHSMSRERRAWQLTCDIEKTAPRTAMDLSWLRG